LGDDERFEVDQALREIASEKDQFVIVRSSAVHERIEERGRYESVYCQANLEGLGAAIERVYASCVQNSDTSMGVVVQAYVGTRKARGHLSNERRVSKKVSSWLCESETVSGIGSPHVFPFSSAREKLWADNSCLVCHDKDSLMKMLKQVAFWAQSQNLRVHFEWVWDGTVLWVVQADEVPDLKGELPLVSNIGLPANTGPGRLSVLVAERELGKGTWNKIDCIKTFREAGLQVADVWVLCDRATLLDLQQGRWPALLERDLESLLEEPIVIRMDTTGGNKGERFMLARTDTVSDVEGVKNFLFKESGRLTKSMIEGVEACFIFHRFIPARASAFALAAPGRKRVRIDGLWGLPDGLSYYPHDSYDLSCSGSGEISKRIRYKEEYLDSDEKGRWVPKRAGRPLDWRSSLTEEEVRTIARGTYAVARAVNAPVEVMWFVGIPEGWGLPGCLAWYYSTEEPPSTLYGRRRAITRASFVVRREEDVEALETGARSGAGVSVVRVRPIPDLLRSRRFIEQISDVAIRKHLAVELEGSVLSHAYYLLRSKGVKVICCDPFLPAHERKQFDKLVRDLIPVKIRSEGERVRVVRITGSGLCALLKAKAVEEALELFWAETVGQCREEIVDLLEVLKSLAEQEGFEENELRALADQKRAEKGSFGEGVILKETQEIALLSGSGGSELFDDTESWEQRGKGGGDARRTGSVLGCLPRREGPNVVIPLVPPDPTYRHFGHSVTLEGAGVRVNVRFREKDVVVEVSELRKRGLSWHPRQLKLFDV
jgi:predicted house-cleaning noncanonical NTP pyrophosphatase (MazG superfamily)